MCKYCSRMPSLQPWSRSRFKAVRFMGIEIFNFELKIEFWSQIYENLKINL